MHNRAYINNINIYNNITISGQVVFGLALFGVFIFFIHLFCGVVFIFNHFLGFSPLPQVWCACAMLPVLLRHLVLKVDWWLVVSASDVTCTDRQSGGDWWLVIGDCDSLVIFGFALVQWCTYIILIIVNWNLLNLSSVIYQCYPPLLKILWVLT